MAVATVGAGRVGIGVPKLHHPHNKASSKPTSPFLGTRLGIKPASKSHASTRVTGSNHGGLRVLAAGGGELADAVRDLFLGVGVGLPCTVMECGDMIYRSTLPKPNGLTLTAPGAILALGALSYLWATPGVAPGFFDMFVLAFVERIFRPTYRKVCKFSFFLFKYLYTQIRNRILILIGVSRSFSIWVFCDRMILSWGRNWVRELLEWFIKFHWRTRLLPRYEIVS